MALSPSGRNRSRHKVLPRPREPSGRYQRDQAESEAAILAVVLAQQHRNGSRDDRRRWPVGRLILDGRVARRGYLPADLERAAELYHSAYAELRWTMDSKRPWQLGSGGRARPCTPEDRARIERAWGDVTRVLRDCPSGPRVKQALDMLIISASPDFEERCVNTWIPDALSEGLAALVDHWGLRT